MFDHEKLKKRRLALNLRPKDIYVILGITKSTYSTWESGARVPSDKDIAKLEMIFDVEPGYFLDRTHIIAVYPLLSEENKSKVQAFAKELLDSQEETETQEKA